MSTEQLRLSDALYWLHNELVHIRRIHFTLLVLSVITILITGLSHSYLSDLYKDLDTLEDTIKKLSLSESRLRIHFCDRIQSYRPEGLPKLYKSHSALWQKDCSYNKMIRFFPKEITDLRDKNISAIRDYFEHGVPVEFVQNVNLSKSNLEVKMAGS
jgi:hypothetical protein